MAETKLPATGDISMSTINSNWFGTPLRQVSFSDPEIKYLLLSPSNPSTTVQGSGPVTLGLGHNKPNNPTLTASFTTYGSSYTFWMPAYKTINIYVVGAGGGEGGSGYTYSINCPGCQTTVYGVCLVYGYCSPLCYGVFCSCCNPPSSGTVSGGVASNGGPSSIAYLRAGESSGVSVASSTGGTGGDGYPTSTAGTAGTGGYTSPFGSAPHPSNPYSSPGGNGGGNGGDGGAGGQASVTLAHFATTGYPIWANGVGVSKFIITVGQGGAGGANGAGGNAPAGSDGKVIITWE